ncbi:biotin biosynthesis protein BioC [Chlorobaculum parvum NCIB 8327]|uniref:Malonyl-[acyl-carrier protein] O-methyltransferase n=1 Tax=Chlorobaculum parvum (strain DSM 263 / NCIMB 8327) TaxID=517417 RepID=B3QLR4_CHLP8|nr:malonyl-ACP O-methyltransferase BioC [Chlorobaculum parvum]ACF12400.1 biotin biosynthesis protein BioC [Chlorobaculum parvum NCIB 8327]
MSGRVDKQLVGRRFRRALPSYERNAEVQAYMAGCLLDMVERARGLPDHIGRVLEFGAGAGMLTSRLFERCSADEFFANDLVAESRSFVEQAVSGCQIGRTEFLPGDIEQLDPLPGNLDLLVSNATVQWLHDPARLFERLASSVRPGGIVAFSTFGTENMREIAALGETALGYRSLDELAALAGEAFEVVEIHDELRRQEFESPEAVLRHIRETGVNGVARRTWTRTQHREFLQRYRASYSTGRGVVLTWHPVWCCFRRRES